MQPTAQAVGWRETSQPSPVGAKEALTTLGRRLHYLHELSFRAKRGICIPPFPAGTHGKGAASRLRSEPALSLSKGQAFSRADNPETTPRASAPEVARLGMENPVEIECEWTARQRECIAGSAYPRNHPTQAKTGPEWGAGPRLRPAATDARSCLAIRRFAGWNAGGRTV